MPKAVYTFRPIGLDVWDRRANQPETGARVVKVQPYGCPRNGTMGHCFVADAASGAFYGLVLEASLERAPGLAAKDLGRERLTPSERAARNV